MRDDAVGTIERRIAEHRRTQATKPRLSEGWWIIQAEIDRLEADASTIRGREREEIVDRNAERMRAALKPARRFCVYPLARVTK